MKIVKSILAIAAAAAAFASCQKSEIRSESAQTRTVSFIAQGVETKTVFGTPDGSTYPVLWTAEDKAAKVALNGSATNADVTPSADFKSATITAEFNVDESANQYVFEVINPASAFVGISAEKGWNVNIPSSQTPSAGSVDPSAQILVASSPVMSALPTKAVSLAFSHATAYGRMSITDLPSNAAISKVTLTSEAKLAGRFYILDGEMSENAGTEVLTINTENSDDIWFGCAPAEVAGTDLTITVTTDKGDYEKTITVPRDKNFEAGKIAVFSVSFSGIAPKRDVIYTLVKSTDELTADSKVIIVAPSVQMAISTTQQANNRSAANVTISDETIKNPSASVQVLELQAGNLGNSVAFSTGDGYLYAASSDANHLKTKSELDDNGSFEIKIDEDGIASVIAQGKNTRNVLQYNPNNGQPVFSCYGAASQTAVAIYKLQGSGSSTKLINGEVDKPQAPTYSSLAELVAAGEPTKEGTKVTVTLTDEEILSIYVTSKGYRNGIFLQAGDREIEIFSYDVPEAWEVGGTVSGTLKDCTWKNYNGTWELCPANWNELTYTAPGSSENPGENPGEEPGDEDAEGVFTLTITADSFEGVGSGSAGYAKYNGTQTWIAEGSNGSTFTVKAETYQVMPYDELIQGQKNAGKITSKTDLGTIKSITINDNQDDLYTYTINGGSFEINAGSSASRASSIVVVFEK